MAFNEGVTDAARSWEQSFWQGQGPRQQLLTAGTHLCPPGLGANGFYLFGKGKSEEKTAPKQQKGSPPPGLRSRELISCQAQQSSCGSAGARQEHSGPGFPQGGLRS